MSSAARRWPRPLLWDTHCPPHLALMGMALRWVHAGSKWRTRIVYALLAWHFVGFFILLIAGPALAAPNGDGPEPSPADTSMFGWIDVKDSSGIPISKYFIALDHGNAISVIPGIGDSDKKSNIALAPILELEYGLFKITCQLALWIIGYGLNFEWLDFIAKPFATLGRASESMTARIGVLTLALTLAAAVAAFSIVRGRISKAAYQVGSALVITALMATIFAHPVAALVGSNGYLAKARDVGISISTDITKSTNVDSPAGDKPAINDLQTALADGFVRAPTQILNFNVNADSVGCKGVWNDGIRSGDRNNLKNTIAKCGGSGKRMKYAADHLSGDRLASGAAILLLSGILLLFGCYLVGKIVLAVVLALSQAIMLPVVGTLGVVAGGLQGMAFKMLCNLALALIKIPLTVVYAGAYAALLGAMLKQESHTNPIRALLFSTVLLIIATVAFRRIEAGLKNSNNNVLSFLNRGGGSSELPKVPSPLLRRSSAMAMQAGGAALGVPPTLTGLVVGTGRSLRNPGGGARGGHLTDPDLQQFQAFQKYEHDQQQYQQYQRYQRHEHYQRQRAIAAAAAANGQQQNSSQTSSSGAPPSAAPAPAAGPPPPAAPRATQVLREAPPLHPDVAAGISAMPQQIQPAASLPPVATQPQRPSPRQSRPPGPRPARRPAHWPSSSTPPSTAGAPRGAQRSLVADTVNQPNPR